MTTAVLAGAEGSRRGRGARILRIGSAAVAVVVAVGVFAYAVPQVADYGTAWAVLTRLSWAQLAPLVAATVASVVSCWKPQFARQVGDRLGAAVTRLRGLARRPPVTGWGEAAVRFRGQSTALLARRWPALTVTTAVNHPAGINRPPPCRPSRR